MPNFSVNFSYICNDVVYRKSAVVRASDPDSAKTKIVRFYLSNHGSAESFSFEQVNLSNYNLILV